MKGYVGEACPECANFTLVRNGTCLKCDTCGSDDGVFVTISENRQGGWSDRPPYRVVGGVVTNEAF